MKNTGRLTAAAAYMVFAGLISAAQSPAPAGRGQGPAGAAPQGGGRGLATELGFGLFQQRCLNCHGNPAVDKAPPPAVLREMSPERIHDALTSGVMKTVGDTLSEVERRLVSESVAGRLIGTSVSGDARLMPNQCAAHPPMTEPARGPAWNGWGADVANTRFQPASASGLTRADVPGLRLKWAFGFPNGTSSYGQPTIVSGRVFVGTDTGYVYSLDANTGCVYWSFLTRAGVRNAPTVAAIAGQGDARLAVYFGDVKANVYAVDAQTGRQLWISHVEDHYTARVTGAPTLYSGRLYVPISSWEEFSARTLDYPCCTSRGAVVALDANTGRFIWKTYVVEEPRPTRKNAKGVQLWAPAGASIWNAPTVDPQRQAVYVGTGDATTYPAAKTSDAVMALDMNTGAVKWSYQVHENDSFLVGCNGDNRTENCPSLQGPDWDIPASVILRDISGGGRTLIVGTKPGDILGLDPDKRGALKWRMNVNGTIAGNGPLAAAGPPSGVLWGFAADERTAYFGLTGSAVAAIDINTGTMKWKVQPAGPTARVSYGSATTVIPGVVFQGGSDGKLLALSTSDGSTLWEFETNKTFETVNKVIAKGGSITAPGPTVAGGMVFVGSGYGVLGGTPGNVLLAFGVDSMLEAGQRGAGQTTPVGDLVVEATIRGIREALAAGQISCVQLVQAYVDRIKAYDAAGPALKAIITINPRALEAAADMDQRFAANRSTVGPLHCVPVILKDNYDTADMPTTGGSLTLAKSVPLQDAFVVKKLRDAGALILAKANLTELARGGTSVSSLGGQTRNPYDLARTPGGSSGGTGAAIAASFGIIGTGSDTGQSIRSPASAQSLVGLRPSRGLVSRSGIIPLSTTQDEAGPITRTVEDAARTLDAIAGYDPADPITAFGVTRIPRTYTAVLDPEGLKGARIGVLQDFFGAAAVHQAVNAVVETAITRMTESGATMVRVRIPNLTSLTRDIQLSQYEARSAFDNYLARLGARAPVRTLQEFIERGEFHPSLRAGLEADQRVADGLNDPEYKNRLLRRNDLRQAVMVVLAEHKLDALLYPHQQRLVVPIGEDQVDRNGVLSNSTGFPAITFPGGFSTPTPSAPLGVPVGIELLGPEWSEPVLLKLAYAFEQRAYIRKPPASTPPLAR